MMINLYPGSLYHRLIKAEFTFSADNLIPMCVVVGMICAVMFSADQLFYRAEILNIVDANYIEVLYVDYGNMEAVSVQRIRKLLDVYTVLTSQVHSFR